MPTTLSGTTRLTTPGTTTLDDGSTVSGTVYLDAGHVLEVSGRASTSGADVYLGKSGLASSTGGGRVVIDRSGDLVFSGNNTVTKGSGSTLFRNDGTVDAGGNLSIDGPFVNNGTFNTTGFSTIKTVARDGSTNNGVMTIGAFGQLTFDGGAFYNAGTVTNAGRTRGSFVNQASGTYSLVDSGYVSGNWPGNFTNYGHLITTGNINTINSSYFGNGGDVAIGTGTLDLYGPLSVIRNERVSGGALEVGAGGLLVVGEGTSLTTNVLSVENVFFRKVSSPTTLRLDEDLDYAGLYRQENSLLLLGSHNLTLADAQVFGNPGGYSNVQGSGTLALTGSASLSGMNLLGGVQLRNTGDVGQLDSVGIGDTTNGAARIVNAAGATWTIQNDALIAADSTQAAFVNDGTLVKAGSTGRSFVRVALTSSANSQGHIVVQDGVLDLVKDVSGQSMATEAGARLILEAGASADTQFTFAGTGSSLTLQQAGHYRGTIAGLASTDRLDLADLRFNGQTAAYAPKGPSSGVLTVSDASKSVSLTLLGSYTSASFHLSSDVQGGTVVSVA